MPELVRIHLQKPIPEWNTFAIVACIELARTRKQNPPVPEWISKDYFDAVQQLAKSGLTQYCAAEDAYQTRAILSLLAISKGARVFGQILLNFEEKELLEFELPIVLEL